MKGLIIGLMMVISSTGYTAPANEMWVGVEGEVGSSIEINESGTKIIWLKTSGNDMDNFKLRTISGKLIIENRNNVGKYGHERHVFAINESVDADGIYMDIKGDLLKISIMECD